MIRNPPPNAGDAGDRGLIPGLGRSPEGGNGNPQQYSYLENPMNRGAWWATVHWVAKSPTQLSMHKLCMHNKNTVINLAPQVFKSLCSVSGN